MTPELKKLVEQLSAPTVYGRALRPAERVAIIRRIQEATHVRNYSFLLPLLFSFHRHPLTLENYQPFVPMFSADRPKRLLFKTGRQVGKSLSLAASSVLIPGQNAHFNSLVTTPLGEQVRRLSVNYVRPLIVDSPMQELWTGPGCKQTIYQHEFPNRSNLIFSFASLSADRIRGINADMVSHDEIQDFDPDLLPVIESTTDASEYALMQYTGTPKSLDNTIHGLWMESSQAEWIVKCPHCNHENIPSAEYDLLNMIGPWHTHISEEVPATLCAKCRRPINPRTGHWHHRYKERRERFAGYHIPQIILPLHFANPKKWRTLIEKQSGAVNTSTATFYNEILGESVDAGQKLVSVTDLTAAGCLPWKNSPNEPSSQIMERRSRYTYTVLSVDWSGGGEKNISYTVLTLLGILPDGHIDCLWGKRLIISQDHISEAKECLYWMNTFKVDFLAHDYTGAGALRETLLIQAGVPEGSIIPVRYVSAARQNLFIECAPTENNSHRYYETDKTRSLLYTTAAIKQGILRFFEYDGAGVDSSTSLMNDFLALVEEKSEGSSGAPSYRIIRNPSVRDDFAQAVNVGCLSLWHASQSWPNFAVGKPNAVQVQFSQDEYYMDSQWDVVV